MHGKFCNGKPSNVIGKEPDRGRQILPGCKMPTFIEKNRLEHKKKNKKEKLTNVNIQRKNCPNKKILYGKSQKNRHEKTDSNDNDPPIEESQIFNNMFEAGALLEDNKENTLNTEEEKYIIGEYNTEQEQEARFKRKNREKETYNVIVSMNETSPFKKKSRAEKGS